MNLRHALVFEWKWRQDFYLSSFAFSILSSLYYHFTPFHHVLLDTGVGILSFLYLFQGFGKDVSSWKYYQSLPLTKRELYHFHILRPYIHCLPVMVWCTCYPDAIAGFFTDGPISKFWHAVPLALYLVFSPALGLLSFSAMYEMIRAPFSRNRSLILFFQRLRDVLYWGYAVVGVALLCFFVQNLFPKLGSFLFSPTIGKILLFAIILSAYPLLYWRIFQKWQREELSYTKINFKMKRDLPAMGLGVFLLVFGFSAVDWDQNRGFGKSPLIEAMVQNDLKAFDKLSRDEKLRDTPTEYGWTPLMAAAYLGRWEYYAALKALGASPDGKVSKKARKGQQGLTLFLSAVAGGSSQIVDDLISGANPNESTEDFSAIHLAAFHCNPRVLDTLLEKGADPNKLNVSLETPLHVAARRNCFEGAVSLVDAGARTDLLDKKGKKAIEVVPKKGQGLAYYLEKKGRVPAGK